METMDAIRGRRAVRDYLPAPVPAGLLHQVIAAARWAPSAMNDQPWHFSVVTDVGLLEEIAARAKLWMRNSVSTMLRAGHFRDILADEHFHILYHAPALVAISAPADGQWSVEDCALAAQNLMLAAHDAALGSCWIGFAEGWLNTSDGRAALGLPLTCRVVAPLIVGYPRTLPPPVPRKTAIINWIGPERQPAAKI
jgi:nitroreductase